MDPPQTSMPSGTVTLVFTDIEGSTALLRHLGDDAYSVVLADHHRLLREAVAARGGFEFNTEGDALHLSFASAADAVAAALQAQFALAAHTWPAGADVRVRMGVHTGRPKRWGDDYMGLAVHEVARIAAAGHGGQVLVSEQTKQAIGGLPPGITLMSLGRHRLKDLGQAIELHQVCHSDLRVDFPPLRSLERVAHNLPIQPSSFVGRTTELAQGAALLMDTRLLSLTGPGGTGKTRLAYQLAADLMQVFPDGIWSAELALISDSTLVPTVLTSALGLHHQPGRTATEVIVEHLRTRQALIVLDNCEHVVEASAELVEALTRGCENVRIIATSRQRLRLPGESVWAVAPMGLPAGPESSFEGMSATDAVRLFCQRAMEADTSFELTPANSADVAAICARLDGMPLALELAAAWVRTLSPAQIAARLGSTLDLLSKGSSGAESRQASMRQAIAWSYNLLSAEERNLFRRLAVFDGGWTLEAAEGICGGAIAPAVDVMPVLDSLVDKSLVATTRTEAGATRYRLLEPIRIYSTERLDDAGEGAGVAERHAAFYSQLAAECAREAAMATDLDRLDADHPNLLAALDYLSNSDRPIEHGQLVVDLSSFWERRGHWQLARRELLRYLLRADCDRGLEGSTLCGLARVAFLFADYPEARHRYEQALRIARELGDRNLEGQSVGGLGNVADQTGNYPEARARLGEALSIAGEVGDRRWEGIWLGRLGNVAGAIGDQLERRARFEEAVGIARELGDRRLESYCVGNLGLAAHDSGDYLEARARYEEALSIARELGDRRYEGYWVAGLGEVAYSLGDYVEARDRFTNSVAIARELGERSAEESGVGSLGRVAHSLGEYQEARTRLEEALRLARELGERHAESVWVGSLGAVASSLGNYTEAQIRLAEALRIARELGKEDSHLLDACAELLARLDRCEDAAQLLGAADGLNARAHTARAPVNEGRYESTLANCRDRLGGEILAFASKRGGALEWASAADTALGFLAENK